MIIVVLKEKLVTMCNTNYIIMTKKILFILISLLFAGLSLQAQQEHRYGFRLGLNYSELDFNDNASGIIGGSEDDARIGFMAGFFAQYFLSEKFSIQPELQYSAQGERSKVTGVNTGTQGDKSSDRLKVNMLQLPVFLNFHLKKLNLSVGPQVGIRIWEWERQDNYETIQFSLTGGVGYDITDNLGINLRAAYGLSDAIDATPVEGSNFSASAVNHYVQLSLAYRM